MVALGAVGIGLYFIYRFFIKKSTTEQSITKADTSIEQWTQQAIKTETPTKTPGEWAVIANTIYEDLKYSKLDDNKADATYQIARVKNTADLAMLIQQFGKRQEYFFGIPAGDEKDLPTFVRTNLDNEQIAIVNDNYRRKNIKFQY